MPNSCDSVPYDVNDPTIKVQWCKEIEQCSIKSYTSLNVITPPDAIKCIDTSCNCYNEHQRKLAVYFDSICNALYHSSEQTIPTSKIK